MKRVFALAAALTISMGLGAAAEAKGLLGKWQAKSMTMRGQTRDVPAGVKVTVEFKKGGKFVGVMEMTPPGKPTKRKVENGTWKLEGKLLVTKTRKKTQRMSYTIKGKMLELTAQPKGPTMRMERVR